MKRYFSIFIMVPIIVMVITSCLVELSFVPEANSLSTSILTPLKQFESGVIVNDVKCITGYDLVIKREDGSPACVKSDTASILIKRGWTIAPQLTVTIPQNASDIANGLSFMPHTIKTMIGVNNTVQWINRDSVLMDITSDSGAFGPSLINPNQTWEYTFDKAGTYGYHSNTHPWLKGIVIVLGDK